jgi:cytidylate kinase
MGLIVAIDGPSGAGKGTVARMVAKQLGFLHIDTGALYRAVAYLATKSGISFDDEASLAKLASELNVEFKTNATGERLVFADGQDVTRQIRTEAMSQGASIVGKLPAVRLGLHDLQRRLGLNAPKGAVLEGRDIGTVIFPDAEVKIFLAADDLVRAKRRYDQLKASGQDAEFDDVLEDLKKRDARDRERDVAPCKPASDSIIIDTTQMLPEQVANAIETEVKKKMGKQ